MVVRVDVAPDLLKWAVERAGWDRETVQKRAPKFDIWLSGDQKPTLKQLEQFAQATHTPFGLLFLEEPPAEPVPIPDMRTIGNVATSRPSADLLDTIYICQARQDWYRDYERQQESDPLPFVGAATVDTPADEAAREIRQKLGLDVAERGRFTNYQDALRQLIDMIEGIGVLVMVSGIVGGNTHRTLDPEEFRGFALSDPLAPLIFVNGSDTKAAQIFTLIHELAHVWLGGSALSDAAMVARDGVEDELWCNRVAAEVLVPLAALKRDFRGEVSTQEVQAYADRRTTEGLSMPEIIRCQKRYLAREVFQALRADYARINT